MKKISAKKLKCLISKKKEFSLLDIREIGRHSKGHPFFSVSIPFSVFESRIEKLVPNKNVPIILIDDNDGLSEIVYHETINIGYSNVFILRGGVFGWEKEGYELFDGINIPSKTFGEWIEKIYNTPQIRAKELSKKINSNKNVIVFDGRSYEEYRKMNIPTAINCPNMEIPIRINKLVEKNTEIVVACAGRTRSIIGTQNLLNFGIKNTVKALRNGTQGWTLSNLNLEFNQTRRCNFSTVKSNKFLKKKAKEIIEKYNLDLLDLYETIKLSNNKSMTTYIFDIREKNSNRAKFQNRILNIAGGQLIQTTDNYIGVWNSNVILLDDGELVRASMTASWLKQMGHRVYVYKGNVNKLYKAMIKNFKKFKLPKDRIVKITDLKNFIYQNIIDVRNSHDYREAHVKRSKWVTRSKIISLKLKKSKQLLIICDDTIKAKLIAKSIYKLHRIKAYFYFFEKKDFTSYLSLLTKNTNYPKNDECIDFNYHTYKRHRGNKTHSKEYLSWEKNLLKRLDEQEIEIFKKL